MTNLVQQIEKAFAESDAQAIADVPALIVEARQQYREMKAEYFAVPYREQGQRQRKMEAIKAMFSVKFRDDFDWGEAEHINRHIAAVKKSHEQRNAASSPNSRRLALSQSTLITSKWSTVKTLRVCG